MTIQCRGALGGIGVRRCIAIGYAQRVKLTARISAPSTTRAWPGTRQSDDAMRTPTNINSDSAARPGSCG